MHTVESSIDICRKIVRSLKNPVTGLIVNILCAAYRWRKAVCINKEKCQCRMKKMRIGIICP